MNSHVPVARGISYVLVDFCRPDLVDMERVQIQSNRENAEQAFEAARRLRSPGYWMQKVRADWG